VVKLTFFPYLLCIKIFVCDDDDDLSQQWQWRYYLQWNTMVAVLQENAEWVSSSRSRHLSGQRSRHLHQCTVWKWNSWRRWKMRLRLSTERWGNSVIIVGAYSNITVTTFRTILLLLLTTSTSPWPLSLTLTQPACMHWVTLRHHSDLFWAATSASSQVIPILNQSLLTVLSSL